MAIDPPRYDEDGNMNVTFHANPKNSLRNQKNKHCYTPRGSGSSNEKEGVFFASSSSAAASNPALSSIYYRNNLNMNNEGKSFLFSYRLSISKLLILAIIDIFVVLFAVNYFYPSIFEQLPDYVIPRAINLFNILSNPSSSQTMDGMST